MSTMIKGIEMPEPTENEISPVNAMMTAKDSTSDQALSIFTDQAKAATNTFVQAVSETLKRVTETFKDTVEILLKCARTLVKQNRALALGRCYYPKYYHYAMYGKKYRTRKKYMDRLIKLSLEEKFDDGRDVENAESDN